MERWRLSFPPHRRDSDLRLACQLRVERDLVVHKHGGFWGHRVGEPREP
jgi:ferredoxin